MRIIHRKRERGQYPGYALCLKCKDLINSVYRFLCAHYSRDLAPKKKKLFCLKPLSTFTISALRSILGQLREHLHLAITLHDIDHQLLIVNWFTVGRSSPESSRMNTIWFLNFSGIPQIVVDEMEWSSFWISTSLTICGEIQFVESSSFTDPNALMLRMAITRCAISDGLQQSTRTNTFKSQFIENSQRRSHRKNVQKWYRTLPRTPEALDRETETTLISGIQLHCTAVKRLTIIDCVVKSFESLTTANYW